MDNNIFIKSFVSFLILVLINGCSTTSALFKTKVESREKYIMSNPSLSSEIKQAILEGKVVEGMSKEDVRATWGEPTEIDNLNKDKNVWWYEENSEWWHYELPPSFLKRSKSVKFKKDIVVTVQGREWYDK